MAEHAVVIDVSRYYAASGGWKELLAVIHKPPEVKPEPPGTLIPAAFAFVSKSDADQLGDVSVIEVIENEPSVSPRPHEAQIAEHPKVLGHGRRRETEHDCQVQRAELLLEQRVDDRCPCPVRERPEEPCHPTVRLAGREGGKGLLDSFTIYRLTIAQ